MTENPKFKRFYEKKLKELGLDTEKWIGEMDKEVYKWRCPKCKQGVNVNPTASFFKCGVCGYAGRK